jgi:hypothetical protein
MPNNKDHEIVLVSEKQLEIYSFVFLIWFKYNILRSNICVSHFLLLVENIFFLKCICFTKIICNVDIIYILLCHYQCVPNTCNNIIILFCFLLCVHQIHNKICVYPFYIRSIIIFLSIFLSYNVYLFCTLNRL